MMPPAAQPQTRRGHAEARYLPLLRQYAPVLFVVFVVLVFARTFDFGLYLDDYHHARPWTLPEVLGTFIGPFDPLGIEPPYFRPLAVVSFAIDWSLWGYNAWGYHLTNVLLHALSVLLFYNFLRRTISVWSAALIGALFFALIPANAVTAIYISERSDALVVIFAMASLLCLQSYLRTQRARWLIGLNVMVLLALCSKEISVALPLLIVLVWVYLTLPEPPYYQSTPDKHWNAWREYLVGGIRALCTLLNSRWLQHAAPVVAPPLVLLVGYLSYRILVLPSGLVSARYSAASPLHGFASAVLWTFKAVPWETPSLPLPFLIIAIALAFILRAGVAAWRVVLLGVAWVLVSCLPLSYLGQVEPRLLYLPSAGYAIVVSGLSIILSDATRAHWASERFWKRLAAIFVVVIASAFFCETAVSQFRAQNEFLPLGYKMLHGEYEIYTDIRHRHLYPAYYLTHIEQDLRQAGKIP